LNLTVNMPSQTRVLYRYIPPLKISFALNGVDCVAILDGPSSDDGTCFEVGYAVAKGIPVVGVRTDYRASQEMGCNLMLSRGCTTFVHRPAFDEDFDGLAKDIVLKLKRILAAITSV